eukprot:gnl/Dysnectes_brevis/3129_a3894_600.p1 GENE.gnl/Dysnectes_brevis/3129_a3894_600~~gnl/Dysnectes_brevis/3129_a3894_600.p1  ORF type:complete len:345 (-),score=87.02 gnl/Dysnectes_brevis/3129_a3894_600:114-1148(-)
MTQLLRDKHFSFLVRESENVGSFESVFSEYVKLSGIYWTISAADLLDRLDDFPSKPDELFSFVMECLQYTSPTSAGFGGSPKHDPHLLYTLSALQILAITRQMHRLTVEQRVAISNFISELQQPDGSFAGDKYGEIDSRFTYTAVCALGLLGYSADPSPTSPSRPLELMIDVAGAIRWIQECANPDGGFGVCPGAESHGGQMFCALGALSILHALSALPHRVSTGRWLALRQVPEVGGMNGRPEKLADVCYSWWVGAPLWILGAGHTIDHDRLTTFILRCQDQEGGISDRPEHRADAYHTFFGLGALGLMGREGVTAPDPAWALPAWVVREMGLTSERLALYEK